MVDHRHVSTADGRINPRPVAGMIGEENREWSAAWGDENVEAKRSFVVRPELQTDLAQSGLTILARACQDGADVAGGRRHRAEDPVLELVADDLAAGGPVRGILYTSQRIGEEGVGRQSGKVRCTLAGAALPILPGPVAVSGW